MKEKELLIATGNQGKFEEICSVLGGLNFKLLSLSDLEISSQGVEESGETFEENSFIKAQHYAKQVDIPVLAEDSGLLVDALPNQLGVFTRRWGAGEKASDEDWLDYFMEKMEEVEERGAHFVCNACLYYPQKNIKSHFEGRTSGVITREVLAPIKNGIPLSSCFVPEGMDKVYSLLSPQEKNEVSHRGKSLFGVKQFLISMEEIF